MNKKVLSKKVMISLLTISYVHLGGTFALPTAGAAELTDKTYTGSMSAITSGDHTVSAGDVTIDASGYIEGLFEKAWAGQVQSEAQVQPAAAVVPAADALAAAPKVQTIARNPFMAPAAMLNKPTVHPGAVIGGGAPVYAAQPVLRGIINNGVKQLAIIEFNNTSNYYKDGQSFGDYTVTSIGIDSVDLSHPQNPLHLTLGRNN